MVKEHLANNDTCKHYTQKGVVCEKARVLSQTTSFEYRYEFIPLFLFMKHMF
jgi:hypothetical protein